MKSAGVPKENVWMDFTIDPRGVRYIRATEPSKLSWEGIGATIRIAAEWTAEARKSNFAPKANVLVIKHAVVSAILDELLAACHRFAGGDTTPFSVVFHGTPLELGLSVRGEEVSVEILEYVGYSDLKRTLGLMTIPRNDLCMTVAGLVEKFAQRLVAENPSLEKDLSVRAFQEEVGRLRRNLR
jgi:hypothetical protein